MGFFKAGVQYGDWKGTAAADCYGGGIEVEHYLEKKKLLKPGERCIAMSFSVGENRVGEKATVYGSAYLVEGVGVEDIQREFDDEPDAIPVREVSFNFTHDDFVTVFKRFDVMLTLRGLKIEDREYRATSSQDEGEPDSE
jgi:hypothetical protein